MDILGKIVRDWIACSPNGSVVPGSQLSAVLERALARVQSSSVAEVAREDAHALLSVHGGGLPALLRLLHVSGQRSDSIHFLHFWRAFHELWRRLRSAESVATESEPIAEEIAEFRDTLLRRAESDEGLTKQWLLQELETMKAMSADCTGWEPLLTTVAELNPQDSDDQLGFEQVSVPIFNWLRSLATDYRRGEKRAAICAVRDVQGCGMHDACLRLGKHVWDIEATLRSYHSSDAAALALAVPQAKGRGHSFGRSPPPLPRPETESWSSSGARLRKDEVECPICMETYGVLPPVQFKCCLQVMCTTCRERIANERGYLSCPFCRTVDRLAESERQEASAYQRPPSTVRGTSGHRSSSLSRVCRRVAGRAFERIAAVQRS